jgi:hypothetical protein
LHSFFKDLKSNFTKRAEATKARYEANVLEGGQSSSRIGRADDGESSTRQLKSTSAPLRNTFQIDSSADILTDAEYDIACNQATGELLFVDNPCNGIDAKSDHWSRLFAESTTTRFNDMTCVAKYVDD